MNCKECSDLFVVALYGSLTNVEKESLQTHMNECQRCAQLYQKISAYQNLFYDQEATLPEWERSWRVISQKIFTKKQNRYLSLSRKRWILATAAVSLMFIIGFFIGRQFFQMKSSEYLLSDSIVDFIHNPIQSYAESLELLLINFNNRGNQPIEQKYRDLEGELITNMLIQTRLLKYLIQSENNDDVLTLFDELELLLVSMSNLKPEDTELADQLIEFIYARQLKLRLRQLKIANSI